MRQLCTRRRGVLSRQADDGGTFLFGRETTQKAAMYTLGLKGKTNIQFKIVFHVCHIVFDSVRAIYLLYC